MVLLLGFALVLIGSCLYNFPAASINNVNTWNTDDLENPFNLGYLVAQYAILLGLCTLIVLVFISVSLAVRIRVLNTSMVDERLYWRGGAFLWPLLIFCLVFVLVLFDYFIFDSESALFFTLPGWVEHHYYMG